MNNMTFFVHTLILLLLQFVILDNIQLHSYVYIDIYILSIYILPYRFRNVLTLLFGFLLGLIVDLANHTGGIHAAATTLLAYLRPYLLTLLLNREQLDEQQGKQKISDTGYFFKFVLVGTFIFNVVLIISEAFTFRNFSITLLRIICSTGVSIFFIMAYYFIALKRRKKAS